MHPDMKIHNPATASKSKPIDRGKLLHPQRRNSIGTSLIKTVYRYCALNWTTKELKTPGRVFGWKAPAVVGKLREPVHPAA